MYRNKDLNYIMSCIEKSLDGESHNQLSEAAKRIDEQHDKMNAVVEAAIEERRLWDRYNAIKFTDDKDARLTAAERDKVTKRYVVACQKTDDALEAYEGDK